MRFHLKSWLFAASAAGALSAAGASWADGADSVTTQHPGNASAAVTADTDAASTDATTSAVEQIVVTAERREETVEKVPATLQAFSGETVQKLNIETLDDLIKYTPNVTFGQNGPGQGVIFMRGLSAGLQGNQSSATIATFPNVAVYLDDQSMQFPARNVDIYAVDLQRIEVLEGPQGTLFGGGAEAGAVRYITNKPQLSAFSGTAEASGGGTSGGGANYAANAMLNIPIVADKIAVRIVGFYDRQGGYIDNVASNFTRSNADPGNGYFNITPNGSGICPNGQPAGGPHLLCTLPGTPVGNNSAIAGPNSNPTTYEGARASALFQVNDDWNVLITESFQNLDAEGIDAEYPTGSDFQPLKPLQITAFSPSFDHDNWENTAWTVNGKIGPLKAIYTGGYMDRHIDQQMDYSNYSRSVEGIYYTCTGGSNGLVGAGTPLTCFSPVSNWRDKVHNTHLSNEFRLSTPDDWRLRAIGGVFEENFRIYDDMNFNYKTIPDCDATNLAIALGGGQPCLANVHPAPGSTANDPSVRGDNTAFGEDTQRGYDQLAFFASIDYDIIPHVLTVTLGTRWYQYKEFEVGSEYETGTACLNVLNGGCVGYNPATGSGGGMFNINDHNDHVTYEGFKSRANVTWKITPDILGYFTYSEGFRPGGFNRTTGGVADLMSGAEPQFNKPNGYAPDSLTNYEMGLKMQLFDHRLVLNLSGYHMDWDNVQLLFFNPTELGNTTFGVNGPNYSVNGGEVQFDARVTDQFSIDGSGTYNVDTQTSSPCLIDNEPGTPAAGGCITQVFEKGVGLVPFQNPFGAIGTVPAFSPKFEGNIRGRYEWKVGPYKAFAQVGVTYIGSMFNQPATYTSGAGIAIPTTTLLRYEMPGYATVDASVGISNDKYSLELYSENLGNSHAAQLIDSEQFIKSEVPIRPRIIEVKVGAKF